MKTPTKLANQPLVSQKHVRCDDAWKVDGVALFAIAALSGLAYAFGVSPLLERHVAVRQQEVELIVAREKAADAMKTLAAIQRQQAVAQQEIAASPLRQQPAGLLNQRLALVTELAGQNGAGLDDLQPGKIAPGTRYDGLPIHVAGTGSYPTFSALVHRLRREFPDTGVNRFEIAGSPQDATGSARFSFDLIWYTAPSKTAERVTKPKNDARK